MKLKAVSATKRRRAQPAERRPALPRAIRRCRLKKRVRGSVAAELSDELQSLVRSGGSQSRARSPPRSFLPPSSTPPL